MYGFYEALRCIVWAIPDEDLETIAALGMTCKRVRAYALARLRDIKARERCSLRALRCYYRLRAQYAYVPGQPVCADALHDLGVLNKQVVAWYGRTLMANEYAQREFATAYERLRQCKRRRTKSDDIARNALKVVVRDWDELTRKHQRSGKKRRRRKHYFY